MSDYFANLNSRMAFLAMKERMVGLTPEESAEWERIKKTRVRQTADGTIWVEDATAPQTVADWKAIVVKLRAAPARLIDDSAQENKPQT